MARLSALILTVCLLVGQSPAPTIPAPVAALSLEPQLSVTRKEVDRSLLAPSTPWFGKPGYPISQAAPTIKAALRPYSLLVARRSSNNPKDKFGPRPDLKHRVHHVPAKKRIKRAL